MPKRKAHSHGQPPQGEAVRDGVASTGEVRAFLDRLYWVLGTFSLGWSLSAIVGIYRHESLELPILGKTDTTETIIFTSIGLGILLPLLLFVVATWRNTAVLRHWKNRYPGAPSEEWDIPATFGWLRGVMFFLLVCVPVATMQLCYQRMLGLDIQWLGDGEKVILRQSNAPGRTLFSFVPRPAPQNDYSNWRWIGSDVSDNEKHPSKITAAPGYMPWAFKLISYGTITVATYFLLVPPGGLARWRIKRPG